MNVRERWMRWLNRCRRCDGRGRVRQRIAASRLPAVDRAELAVLGGYAYRLVTCPDCHGSGQR